MKKLHLYVATFAVLAVSMLFAYSPIASAADIIPGSVCANNPDAVVCVDDRSGRAADNPIFGPSGVLTVAMSLLSGLVGIISVVVIVVSGLRMILANGDSQSFGKARKAIILALVALVIAILAQAIVAFVLSNISV